MKLIYVNLKRFDVPTSMGGVNSLADVEKWGSILIKNIREITAAYSTDDVRFTFFFPEAHLISAVQANTVGSNIHIGCQGVYRTDITPGGNFGAFTTLRPAAAAKALGCTSVIIGHCEQRRDLENVLDEAGTKDTSAINRLLNKEISCALAQGLKVLYCIGEKAQERENWKSVLEAQLNIGLQDVNTKDIVIAYEPIWAIGPGKTPPSVEQISEVARFIKKKTNDLPLVYGGGLKKENATMISKAEEIDGGLIALTRFSGEIGFYPEEFLEIVDLYMHN